MNEVGKLIITNALCYQDLVAILLNNGYAVEIQPMGNNLEITIKEAVKAEPKILGGKI